MDRKKIEEESLKFFGFKINGIADFSERIANTARNEALEEAIKEIYLLEKDGKCAQAIRALIT